MTHVFSLSNGRVHVSDFSLKALIKTFLQHCEYHGIGADEYVLTEFKASHDSTRGAWEEKTEQFVWIDPVEEFDAIYEALKNV